MQILREECIQIEREHPGAGTLALRFFDVFRDRLVSQAENELHG
ncbi:MAG: hypothetical protein ACLPY1_08945 [Terracidiphilus sp.]